MNLVLDASVVMNWCFPDEAAQKAVEISERIAAGAKVSVPGFWRHEILNALLVGEKRRRLSPELTRAFIEDLYRLPVETMACLIRHGRGVQRHMKGRQT